MNNKPASQETIDHLKDSMLTTGKTLYAKIYKNMVLEDGISKGVFDKVLHDRQKTIGEIRLDSNVALIIMELCFAFRAELTSVNAVEKRFLLKRIVMICHEGYKYLFGFTGKPTPAKAFMDSLDDSGQKKKVKGIHTAANDYFNAYGNKTYKDIRDVAKHFSYNSLEYYSCIKGLDEQTVSDMIIKFLVFAQPVHELTSGTLYKDFGQIYSTIKSYDIPKQSIKLLVKTEQIALIEKVITKYGKDIDSIDSATVQGKTLLEKYGIDTSQEALKPFLSDNIGQHVLYVVMDVLCAVKAFTNSKDFCEQSLHLAYVRLSIHEGFKKLYGYNDKDRISSYWSRIKRDLSNVLHQKKEEINKIEAQLDDLSKEDYVNSEDTAVLTHFGDIHHESIPNKAFGLLASIATKKNLEILPKVITTFNHILPLMSALLQAQNTLAQQKTEKEIEELTTKMLQTLQTAHEKATPEVRKNIGELMEKIKAGNEKIKDLLR